MVDVVNLIKDLRNKTGAGFLDCKNALSECDNNLDNAYGFWGDNSDSSSIATFLLP